AKAFYIARTGRPGPVLVDIPKDVTDPGVRIPYEYPKKISMRSYKPVEKGNTRQVRKAVDLMVRAQRPVVYTGGGVILGDASDDLRELISHTDFPITNTLMGLGSIAASDKHFLGMLGMHGTYEANMAMHEADLIIAIGARFDDRVTGKLAQFCPNAKIVHVDVDPASISKNVRVDVPIVGQVRPVIRDMLKFLKERKTGPDKAALREWWERINAWRSVECLNYANSDKVIKPQYAIETLHKVTRRRNFYLTSDVGQHQMFAAQFYPFEKPRRWINSGGLGTMGFGLPAAMGVQQAFPKASVACVTGEASIQMCIQELATCSQYNLPIKIVLLNNGYMGMVRQWQEFFYDGRYSHSYVDALPDFAKLAETYGHVGMTIEDPNDMEAAYKEAFSLKDRLVFMNVIIDPEENVYPMIEAGKGHHEMHMSPHLSAERELA
ncbi:biosynthetic-type acetolactate synthase large subunit, partial [Thiolapillus sp.]